MTTSDIIPRKPCSICKRKLPATPEYYDRQATGKYGVTSVCKECQGREFGIHHKRASKQERSELEGQGLRRCLRCDDIHPIDDFSGRYCKYCRRKYEADKRERNRDEINTYHRRWVQANRITLNAKRRARWKDNPDHYRLKQRGYQAVRRLRISAVMSDVTPEVIQRLFESQNGKCYWCGKKLKKFELDHIHPLAQGGTHTADNVCCSCVKCNRSKGSKTPQEWGRLL